MYYGYDDDPYAAQVMLQGYRPMDVGDAYGVVPFLEVLGPILDATTVIATTGIAAGSAGAQGRLGLQASEAQAEVAAYQAQIAEQTQAAETERFTTAAFYAAGVVLLLGGGFLGYKVWSTR